jgi:HAD superfamily hydrolase (TIGR01549 family)
MFVRRILRGHGLSAYKELILMLRHRHEIEKARKQSGRLATAVNGEIRAIEKSWYEPAIRKAGLRTGIIDVVSFLNSQGIPQVVVSDYEVTYKLESLGLMNRFAATYVGEELGVVKPNPELFARVATDFKVPVSQSLHFGDRADTDEAAARAAGCRSLIIARDFSSFATLLDELRMQPTHADKRVRI